MTVKIIDPHLHLFAREIGDYHWLKSDHPPFWPDKILIQRNFTINDLAIQPSMELGGFVHIEAGFDNQQPWRELEFLEALESEQTLPLPMRTIGTVNLLEANTLFKDKLKKQQAFRSLVGVRHILDEQAFDILTEQNAQKNLAYLNTIEGFIFELQLALSDELSAKVTPILLKTITENSQLTFILNHAGFPPYDLKAAAWKTWQDNIAQLAKLPNVFIKCSGMEMIDRKFSMQGFEQVLKHCLAEFSLPRVMLASNFPLCILSGKSYVSYWQGILECELIQKSNKQQKSALLYDNALRIYQLNSVKLT